MKGRRAGQACGLLLGLALLGLALFGLWGCASEAPRAFPVYKPTAPFLAEQERVRRGAAEIRAFRGSERMRNVLRHHRKTLAAWEPIYMRVRLAETLRERARAAGLKDVRIRVPEAAVERMLKPIRERRGGQ